MRHWRSDSQASSLLRIAVSWLQLSLGTGVSFLQDVTTAHPHCEAKWLASLRLFLASINGSIDLDETFVPPLQRERDFYLMDDLLSSGDFNDKQLFAVNYCRVYLQVVTLSDMAMADGTTLDMNKRNGHWSLASSRTRLNWINQERPPEKAWGTWRRACDLWASHNGKLKRPLGCWLHPLAGVLCGRRRFSLCQRYRQHNDMLFSVAQHDSVNIGWSFCECYSFRISSRFSGKFE